MGRRRAPTAAGKAGKNRRAHAPGESADSLAIRAVRRGDLEDVIAIDATVTGIEKRSYWRSVLRRYGVAGDAQRQFLVAEVERRVIGFVIGEVRDWEFGSPPCGWVFAIDVRPDARQAGVGARLLARSRPDSGARASPRCARCSRATTR